MSIHFVQIDHASMVLTGDCQWYYAVNNSRWDAGFHNDHDQVNLLFLDGHVRYTQLTRGESWTDSYNFIPRPDDLPSDSGQSTGN
jgi:prepilin-type processing-associated H-X9-DG protein